jgi:hypothetical protein
MPRLEPHPVVPGARALEVLDVVAPVRWSPSERQVVKPFVSGISVRDLLRMTRHHNDRVWVDSALDIVWGVADVVVKAWAGHDKHGLEPLQIVHPALHAGNVFVTDTGEVRVTDWGAWPEVRPPSDEAAERALTRLGPAARHVGIEASIRSLGWLLLQLLTAGGRQDVAFLASEHSPEQAWMLALQSIRHEPKIASTLRLLTGLGTQRPIHDPLEARADLDAIRSHSDRTRLSRYMHHLAEMGRIGRVDGLWRPMGLAREVPDAPQASGTTGHRPWELPGRLPPKPSPVRDESAPRPRPPENTTFIGLPQPSTAAPVAPVPVAPAAVSRTAGRWKRLVVPVLSGAALLWIGGVMVWALSPAQSVPDPTIANTGAPVVDVHVSALGRAVVPEPTVAPRAAPSPQSKRSARAAPSKKRATGALTLAFPDAPPSQWVLVDCGQGWTA